MKGVMKMTTTTTVTTAFKKKFEDIAEKNGAVLSKYCDSILKLKMNMIDEYSCPCYPNDDEHWCMSQLCQTELNTKGRCHCGLFVKKEM